MDFRMQDRMELKAFKSCAFWVVIWLSLYVLLPLSASTMDCPQQRQDASTLISYADTMTDRHQIEQLYSEMYQAMIDKDTVTLNRVHADEFVLIHMTGMRQSKKEYIQSISNGMLNYYSAEHEQMEIKIDGDQATLIGRSYVTAAVFGGGKSTWRLQLSFHLVRRNGLWQFTQAKASTY